MHFRTSRPKARDGHRYPRPALVFVNVGHDVSRAAAPEGTGQMDGRTDGQMDGQILPVFYRTLSPPVPSGAAAQKALANEKGLAMVICQENASKCILFLQNTRFDFGKNQSGRPNEHS